MHACRLAEQLVYMSVHVIHCNSEYVIFCVTILISDVGATVITSTSFSIVSATPSSFRSGGLGQATHSDVFLPCESQIVTLFLVVVMNRPQVPLLPRYEFVMIMLSPGLNVRLFGLTDSVFVCSVS